MTRLVIGKPRIQEPLGANPYDRWLSPDGDCMCEFHRTTSGFTVRFPDEADFEIDRETGAVVGIPAADNGEKLVQKLFDNSIVPLIGNHNGGLLLHGSAVRTAYGAVAFIGHSRSGKTTLAGSFAKSGHPFMAEDVVDLDKRQTGYLLRPKNAGLHLFKDSAEFLLGETVDFAEEDGKRRIGAEDDLPFSPEPQRLAAIFILGGDHPAALSLEPMSSSAALQDLMQHGFILDVEDRSRLKSHFNRLAELAETVPVFKLNYPRDYSALPHVIDAIIEVVQRITAHEDE